MLSQLGKKRYVQSQTRKMPRPDLPETEHQRIVVPARSFLGWSVVRLGRVSDNQGRYPVRDAYLKNTRS
ncbi:hypothetical protein ACFL2H_04695 [Planctomycetota bacterium]